jgi:predicted AlkP superfamily phosphohydrolase/phosphomutase
MEGDMTKDRRKAIILGLDGATLDVLLPRSAGQMVNLAALLARGSWGAMQSTTPPFSAQAWASMTTGKNPARHGVVDFWERSPGQAPGQRGGFVTARQIQGETLWQIAGRHGRQVGVVNVPVTYPPTPVSGYLVSGFLTPPGKEDYVYPPALREEIRALVPNYNPDPFDPLGATKGQLVEIEAWMGRHEEVARHLAARYPVDLYFSVAQALDHLQHLFWNEVVRGAGEPGKEERGEMGVLVDRCYQQADEIVGHRLGMLDGRTNLFLVSDHGFGPAHKWFHLNRFLQEQGLLVLGQAGAGGTGALLARLGLTPQGLRGAVRRLDVLGLRRRVGRLARVTIGRRLDESLAPPVDWTRTQAVAGSPATEGVFVNRDAVEPGGAYEALRDRLIASLLELRDADTGQGVVRAAHRREELYEGPFLPLLPDIVLDMGDGPYLISDSLTAGRVLAPLPSDQLQGRHRPLGVFAAAGPDIQPLGRFEGARVVDVAPTVLYALGLPIPDDMDGRPLLEIFTVEYRAAHPVQIVPAAGPASPAAPSGPAYDDEDQEEMERRLKGLGYVS